MFQCGMLGLKAHVVDCLPQPGGQCMALYPEKPVYDIPAFPSISGGRLVELLLQQAAPFRPVYHLSTQVTEVDREGKLFIVRTSGGEVVRAGAVLIAGGAGSFRPNRPPLIGIEEFEGKGIHYAVLDRTAFDGKDVVIVGGGDSAVDWAVELAGLARSVSVVHRRHKFTAAPATVEKLYDLVEHGRIRLMIPGQVARLHGRDGVLAEVSIANATSEITIAADAVLFFLGLASSLGPVGSWGLSLNGSRVVVEPTTMETSDPGVFAIGDIAVYPNKIKLILCGFSEAALAAHAIHRFLRPNTPLNHQHSTLVGIPTLAPMPQAQT